MKFLLIYLIVFLGCQSQKKETDTLIIQEYLTSSYDLQDNFHYLESEKIAALEVINIYNRGARNKGISQLKKSERLFDKNDIEKLRKESLSNVNSEWKDFHFKKKFKLLSNGKYDLTQVATKIHENGYKNWLFRFSDPVFNEKKDGAMFAISITRKFNHAETFVVLCQKKKDHWVFLKRIEDTSLH